MILQKTAHLATWSFGDLTFSKLPLDELAGSQICALQTQQISWGLVYRRTPGALCSSGEQASGGSSHLILTCLWTTDPKPPSHQPRLALSPPPLPNVRPEGRMAVKGRGQV